MIKKGTTDIAKIYYADSNGVVKEVKSVYQGSNSVFGDIVSQYLTFVAIEDAKFTFTGTTVNSVTNSLSYSLDNGSTWVALASGSESPVVNAGKKIMWKGTTNAGSTSGSYGRGKFSASADFDAKGNVMSIIYGDDFIKTSIGGNYSLYGLFEDNTHIVNAKDLALSATTLSIYCYTNMFKGCTGLTTAPQLPSMDAKNSCYNSMFYGCTKLVTAPELPFTTTENAVYGSMFRDCTSLENPPSVLPATNAAQNCYQSMFYGCSKLTKSPIILASKLGNYTCSSMFGNCSNLKTITCLATDLSGTRCTYNWVSGVASSGTFIKHPNMSSWETGNSGIPSNWTVQDYQESQ